jgi:general nucleoside transport system permease protein
MAANTSTTSGTFEKIKVSAVSNTRKISTGVVEIILGLFTYFVFAVKIAADAVTTYGLNPAGTKVNPLPNWVVPTRGVLIAIAIVCVLIGIFQLVKGFGKATNAMTGVVFLLFVFSFLTAQGAGKSMNLVGMLSSAVTLAVPIVLAAFTGILCESAGVVNIAIEGMMLMAAMVAALVGSVTQNGWIGLLAGTGSAVLLALIHAMLSIKYKINQIISGTVINIFAAGMTAFFSKKFLEQYQDLLNNPPVFPRIELPLLGKIPLLGPVFFDSNIYVYLMYILLIVIQVALFTTRWGLRMRSVGEHPKAADTLGINVIKTRYMAVLLGGVVAGLAGTFFTLGSVGRFNDDMTAGKGFIGLAAMIFGNYSPFGAFAAGILFGFADSVATNLSLLGSTIPSSLISTAPYVITMIVLAGFVGKGHVPAADGVAYDKEG